MFSKQTKINSLFYYFLITTCVYASLSALTWELGKVYTSLSSDQSNFIQAQIGFANTILSENSANVTVALPQVSPPLSPITVQSSLPDILYIGGDNDNQSVFDFGDKSMDVVFIVGQIKVFNSSTNQYENKPGSTRAQVTTPEEPELVFIAVNADGLGNPPNEPVLLHELLHRSGHVPPRVSGPEGHTEDGNVMRNAPRNQEDRGLTPTQITNMRNHIQDNLYYPQL